MDVLALWVGRVRLPWLQIDADGQTRARLLGRLLGIPETQGIGMAMALWTWALEMADDGDFSGEVRGDFELVAAAVSWPVADADRLLVELQRVGFVATDPRLRVRGLDRYRRTWEKNRRKHKPSDFGWRVPETGENPRGPAPEPARKTETETETENATTYSTLLNGERRSRSSDAAVLKEGET